MTLRIDSGRDRLAAVEILDREGQTVHSSTGLGRTAGDAVPTLTLGLAAHPHSLVLHVVTDSMTKAYPFSLALDE
ncbi:hypothetical protein ACMDCT_06260 [Halomonadaceae bacterium KBTZ08]